MPSTTINEDGLEAFRRARLAPKALLKLVERHVRVLVRLSIGVGKSTAVDGLLEHPGLYQGFDFVVYAAPTWSIIRERSVVRGSAQIDLPWMLMRPRPKDWCADYAELWAHYEQRSCSTYAKATLCRECQRLAKTVTPCVWPSQFSRVKHQSLLFLTEQQLVLNRSLIPMLRSIRKGGRILVILDEARMLDANFEVTLAEDDLVKFEQVVTAIPDAASRSRWLKAIATLRQRADLAHRIDIPPWLNRDCYAIQDAGVRRFGDSFRYVGYDLTLLAGSHPTERWRVADGIRFVGRPLLNCHALLLSAHLSADYVGERLGAGPIASPFENVTFRHSGTRIINLRNRAGADRHFFRNHTQLLDTIAVLIARNVGTGTSTLLISRKKSKELCASYLSGRLAAWGITVKFACEDYSGLPPSPDPRVIPVIHYGVLGVNDFTEYQAAYCINSYYISAHELTRVTQEATPRVDRVSLAIDSDRDLVRRARVSEGPDPGGVLAHTANIYLRKLELDPVIQAAGRVRFATKPREVVFFQMADLSPLVGDHEVVRTAAQLRGALGIPAARDVDQHLEAVAITEALQAGHTAPDVAAQAGISLRTLRRRVAQLRSANSPSNIFTRIAGTLMRTRGAGGPA